MIIGKYQLNTINHLANAFTSTMNTYFDQKRDYMLGLHKEYKQTKASFKKLASLFDYLSAEVES